MRRAQAETCRVDIWIAGDVADAKRTLRRLCASGGLCVSVTETTFIYKGGEEAGVRVGLINYPRFPTTRAALFVQARTVADALCEALYQHSYCLVTDDVTEWFTARE